MAMLQPIHHEKKRLKGDNGSNPTEADKAYLELQNASFACRSEQIGLGAIGEEAGYEEECQKPKN